MITLSIHLTSAIIGFFCGFVLIAAIFLLLFFDDKWNLAFGVGWDYGFKYGESEAKKQCEESKGSQI